MRTTGIITILPPARVLALCLMAALIIAGAATGASVKKCSHCGATVPMQASFCGECGGKMG